MAPAILNGTLAGALLLCVACAAELPRERPSSGTGDGPPGGAAGATMTSATVTMAGGAYALDSVTGLAMEPEPVASQAVPAPLAPPAVVSMPGDTMPLTAAAAELQTLGTGLLIPVQGVLSAELRDTYTESRGGRVHEAIDIHAARGTPVMAATSGRLLKLFDSRAGGLMVYASDAADQFIFMYGHLDRYAPGLREGMPLQRGQLIGYVGTTGNSPPNAPHLHLAIARGRPSTQWWRGTPVNPYPLFVPPVR